MQLQSTLKTSNSISFFTQFKSRYLFLLVCLFLVFLSFVSQTFILTEDIFFNLLGEQMAYEKVQELIDNQQRWQWVGYLTIPLIYFLKLSLLSLSLMIGVVFLGVKLNFKQLFRVALLAEFVMLIPTFIKIAWFIFIDTEYTFEEVNYFMPLSLSNLFEAGELAIYWAYPLQIANVFELIYWLSVWLNMDWQEPQVEQ
jgi:hypothetical protein